MDRIRGLIYDAEIEKCVPGKGAGFKKDPHFKYCQGWDDHKGMGIAVVCAWDLWEQKPRIFCKGNWNELQELIKERDEIIGFNSKNFDDRLLNAFDINIETTYDLLLKAKDAAGEPPKYVRGESRGGFKLGELAEANGLGVKMMNGADAPKMWQAGCIGKVIDYCMSDVILTRDLFFKRHRLFVKSYNRYFVLRDLNSAQAVSPQQKSAQQRAAMIASGIQNEVDEKMNVVLVEPPAGQESKLVPARDGMRKGEW